MSEAPVDRIVSIVRDAGLTDVDARAVALAWASFADARVQAVSERFAAALSTVELHQLKDLDRRDPAELQAFLADHIPHHRSLTREVVDEFVYRTAAGFANFSQEQS